MNDTARLARETVTGMLATTRDIRPLREIARSDDYLNRFRERVAEQRPALRDDMPSPAEVRTILVEVLADRGDVRPGEGYDDEALDLLLEMAAHGTPISAHAAQVIRGYKSATERRLDRQASHHARYATDARTLSEAATEVLTAATRGDLPPHLQPAIDRLRVALELTRR